MKNLFYLLLFAVLFVSFGGCNNNNNSVDEAWRTANTNAYDSIAKLPDYHALQTASGPTGVYYKDVQTDTTIVKGTVYPLQTSSVKVLYSGTYYDKKTFFDTGTSQNGIPMEFSLIPYVPQITSSWKFTPFTPTHMSRGLSFALQNMVVGDKWEIWIPYYLGYYTLGGYPISSTSTLFQAYTTLIYTVELISIKQYPL